MHQWLGLTFSDYVNELEQARQEGNGLAFWTAAFAMGPESELSPFVISAGFTLVATSKGGLVPVPEGWVPRVARNGKGIVYQQPGSSGDANSIRIMEPTKQYPNGYVRYYNKYGQPLTVDGKPGSDPVTHIPVDIQNPMKGWPK
jgi:hypothetical protein